jgi:hypothetical protein
MMLTYVGLDLGVDTSVLTNSVAPKNEIRKHRAATLTLAGESRIHNDEDRETSLGVIEIVREHNEEFTV